MQKRSPRRPLKLRMLIWEDYFDPSRWSLNITTSFFVRGREFQIENRPAMEQSGEKLLRLTLMMEEGTMIKGMQLFRL